jgi:predicted RNA-binding Zn-ribbon protein involved in translation (DUF1610 family)
MAEALPLTDTRTRLARSQRFFARLLAFDLECPHCGEVAQVRQQLRGRRSAWEPQTARYVCPGCQYVYILGIVAWPTQRGGARQGAATPADQVPSPRQLGSLRKEGGGWWLPPEARQRFARPTTTNVTLEQDRPTPDEDEDEEAP